LSERLGLSYLAQGVTPAPSDYKARKRKPLLKEKTRHKIEWPAEWLRRNGL